MKHIIKHIVCTIFMAICCACSMNSTAVPQASIENISFSDDYSKTSFDITVTDESELLQSVSVILESNNVVVTARAFDLKEETNSYELSVTKNTEYIIKVYGTYEINGNLFSNKLLAEQKFKVSPEFDSNIVMPSKTFIYDGAEHYLEVINLPRKATVNYENNYKSNAGTYQVKAKVMLDGEVIKELESTMTIEKADVVVNVLSNEAIYTGKNLELDFTSNLKKKYFTITYNGEDSLPIECGTYKVNINFAGDENINSFNYETEFTINKSWFYVYFEKTIFDNVVEIENLKPVILMESAMDVSGFVDISSEIDYKLDIEKIECFGTYPCKVTIEETKNYYSTTLYSNIVYYDNSNTKYSTDLFISEVSLGDEVTICEVYNGTYKEINALDYIILYVDNHGKRHYSRLPFGMNFINKDTATYVRLNTNKIDYIELIKMDKNGYLEIVDRVNITNTNCTMVRLPITTKGSIPFNENEWNYIDYTLDGIGEYKSQYSSSSINYPQLILIGDIKLEYDDISSLEEHVLIFDENYLELLSLDKYLDLTEMNINSLGTANGKLKVSNVYGNTLEVELALDVIDTTGPIVESYYSDIVYYVGDIRPDLTNLVYATDNYDGIIEITEDMIVKNDIDYTKVGLYEVKYKVTDSNNNSTEFSIYITVSVKSVTGDNSNV